MKKVFFKKVMSFVLAVLILTGTCAYAIGEELRHSSTSIGMGAQLARGVYYTYNRQTENYMVYTPNDIVTPVVVYGSKICNYGNFNTMAALMKDKGYNVIGGINGDYFEISSYQPLGLVVTDGILRSSDGEHWAIGFRADGSAFIDRPSMSMRVNIGTETYRLSGINKMRSGSNYCLFTEEFSYTTKNTAPGRDVIVSIVPDETGATPPLTMNCTLSLKVEQILDSEGAINLPEGKLVLSLADSADAWRQYGIDNMTVGDIITLEVKSDEKWNSVDNAVGSYVKLVSDGAANTAEAVAGTHPRTAVGIRDDGSIILYTIDGRQSGYSSGFTPEEVAQRLIELGCIDALLLDGGGSTNLHAMYIGDEGTSQINRPSEGRERSVTNYIMLVAKGQGSGMVKNLAVHPYDAIVLAGSNVPFRTGASDETSRAVAISGGITWSEAAGLGSLSQEGIFTAGSLPGNTVVTANAGGLTAGASVTIVDSPSTISILDETTGKSNGSYRLMGGDVLNLTASATYRYMELICSDNAFTWSVIGDIGSIDENGVFTASTTESSGKIMATAGNTSASVDVEIKTDNETLRDFEEEVLKDVSGSANLNYTIENSKDYIKLGNGSLKLEYDLTETSGVLNMPLSVNPGMGFMSLWVYGDNSGNLLQAEFESGALADIATLDFAGWRQIVIPLPEKGAARNFYLWGDGSGTIWLDHIMASTSQVPDLTPPDIQLEVNGDTVSGRIEDDINEFPLASRIELLYDGKPLAFNYKVSNGRLTAKLPTKAETEESPEAESTVEDGIHKVTLRNWDKSGNVASKSVMLKSEDSGTVFGDMQGHWSYDYVAYMSSLGVVNGMESESGLVYSPDSPITRAQFAVMISRWLGLDTSQYADSQLQFKDMESIPDYALDAVKAVCTMGIIKGMVRDGEPYFEPSSTLTRAQAMTVIGRIQRGGYPEAELSFSDGADVPDWALKYVRSLVAQNVIAGMGDGRLVPNGQLTRAQVAKILTEVT